MNEYVDCLLREIDRFDSTGYVVESIFIGGGTPTILSEWDFERIVHCIYNKFTLDLKEFTVEGNPNSYTSSKVQLYKKLGVTRLSVGVQSLNDKVLNGIGRIHTANQGIACLEMLTKSGLDVNCDMMVGLPYQTTEIVQKDIQKVISCGVKSVSCYSLILEDNTPLQKLFESKNIILPSEDETVDMYDIAAKTLQKSGLNRYEISNFGKPCIHNIGYWTLVEYVGFGVAAHSFLDGIRYYNTSDFEEYLKGSDRQVEEVLTTEDMVQEYVMLALRMDSGIDTNYMLNKFGKNALDKLLNDVHKDEKYYNITDKNIAIKAEYMYLSNSLIANLM